MLSEDLYYELEEIRSTISGNSMEFTTILLIIILSFLETLVQEKQKLQDSIQRFCLIIR